MRKVTAVLLFTFSMSASAEYRVYQYIIKNKINTAQDQANAHVIVSTLDPVSYLAYNGGRSTLEVDLLRTWMCAGYTSYKKDLCKSPYGSLPKELL